MFQAQAKKVIDIECEAIASLKARIDDQFDKACQMILDCQGRVIVLGLGKSGHIGNKIAATLASTGTPAFFVHAAEAAHGDFGMISSNDVIIALSNSGKTEEVVSLLPLIQRQGTPIISITGDANSPLAKAAEINLDASVKEEACPLGLAPTASTTTALVLGDALAVALLEIRGFSAEDFALSHPGGNLGKRLLLKVSDLMRSGESIPKIKPDATLQEAILEITEKSFGMTTVTDEDAMLLGVFTDGDVRRAFEKGLDLTQTTINSVMSKKAKTIGVDQLAAKALNIMEQHKITCLVVSDNEGKVLGILHMYDLLKAGIA